MNVLKYNNVLSLFAFSLSIHEKASTILIIGCLLFFFADIVLGNERLCLKKELVPLPLLFLTYIVVSTIASGELNFKWVEHKASLLFIPLLFSSTHKIDSGKIFKSYIYGCLSAYLICLFLAFKNSLHITELGIQFNPLLGSDRGFFEAMLYEGNYFAGIHFCVLMQTSYFGFYLTVALCYVVAFNTAIFQKIEIVIITICLILGIIQTLSLAALGGCFLAVTMIVLLKIKSKKYKITLLTVIFGLLILSLHQPRLKLAYNDVLKDELKLNPEGRYGIMLRLLSWDAAVELIKESGPYGVGLQKSQERLNEKYSEKGYVFPLKQNLNSHNQFLQITIECGILGLGLVLSLFYFLSKKSLNVSNTTTKYFIWTFSTVLFFNLLFESYFNRYIGISTICFCYCVLICTKEEGFS